MYRFLFSLLFCWCVVVGALAQITVDNDSSVGELAPEIILDTAYMRVLYRQETLHDTIGVNAQKSNDVMMLKIGRKVSESLDYYNYLWDSVFVKGIKEGKAFHEALNKATEVYGISGNKEKIYSNYPEGKLTVVNHMMGFYKYSEDIPQIKWMLETGTEVILDYTCLKADCRLFGRTYTAWYTPLLPLGKGPWKFSGLPGLILKVVDNTNQVSWTCIGIQNVKWIDEIIYDQFDYITTNKFEFLKSFSDYKRNSTQMLQNAGMILSDTPLPSQSTFYNPIER